MIDLFSRVVAFPAGQVKLSEGKDVNCILHPGWYPFQAVLINYLPSESTSFFIFFSCFPYFPIFSQYMFPYMFPYIPNIFPRCSHRFPKKSKNKTQKIQCFLRMGHFPTHFPAKMISAPSRFGTDRRGGVLGPPWWM